MKKSQEKYKVKYDVDECAECKCNDGDVTYYITVEKIKAKTIVVKNAYDLEDALNTAKELAIAGKVDFGEDELDKSVYFRTFCDGASMSRRFYV